MINPPYDIAEFWLYSIFARNLSSSKYGRPVPSKHIFDLFILVDFAPVFFRHWSYCKGCLLCLALHHPPPPSTRSHLDSDDRRNRDSSAGTTPVTPCAALPSPRQPPATPAHDTSGSLGLSDSPLHLATSPTSELPNSPLVCPLELWFGPSLKPPQSILPENPPWRASTFSLKTNCCRLHIA